MLRRIEEELDDGSYRPGPWAEFLGVATRRSRANRLELAPDVSRVSDKLHRRRHPVRFPLWVGVVLAAIGTTAGVALLQLGLARTPSGLAIASSIVLTITLQPPIKLAAGYLLGVRCCHFFFFGIETNTG